MNWLSTHQLLSVVEPAAVLIVNTLSTPLCFKCLVYYNCHFHAFLTPLSQHCACNSNITVTDQEECSTVVILLQELVLALSCFVSDELWIQFLLQSAFIFRHVMEPLQFLLLFLNPATHETQLQQWHSDDTMISKSLFFTENIKYELKWNIKHLYFGVIWLTGHKRDSKTKSFCYCTDTSYRKYSDWQRSTYNSSLTHRSDWMKPMS